MQALRGENKVIFLITYFLLNICKKYYQKRGPMPNVMTALPNIGGALCSTPQSLADANYQSAVQ